MKIFRLMTFVLISFIVISCSKDNAVEEQQTEPTNLEVEVLSQERGTFDRKGGADKLMDYFKNEGIEPNFPLSQAEVDRYLSIAGYSGTVNVDEFNTVGNEVMLAQRYGAKEYITNHTNFKEYTKNTLINIIENGYIKDLEKERDFQSLPKSEQIALIGANDLVKEFKGKSASARYSDFDHIVTMGASGAAIGGACCGAGGAVVGGFIGVIVGIFTAPSK